MPTLGPTNNAHAKQHAHIHGNIRTNTGRCTATEAAPMRARLFSLLCTLYTIRATCDMA